MRLTVLPKLVAASAVALMLVSGLGCNNKYKAEPDLWINHSPRELSKKMYLEKRINWYIKNYGPFPSDSKLRIRFSNDSAWWPLFVMIDSGMPYEFKDVCNMYGTPSLIEDWTFIYDGRGECIDDIDQIFVDILNKYLTIFDPEWEVKWYVWKIGERDLYLHMFYRVMGPDSLRAISGELIDIRYYVG